MNRKQSLMLVLSVLAAALILRVGLAAKMGFAHPMESDSYYYLELAKSLAHGTGYSMHDSFWPDSPTLQRMPGWPFLVSVALRVLPMASPDGVMRVLCVLLDSLNAVMVGWLAWRLFGRRGWAFLAGAIYAAHPAALFLVNSGEAEPLFVALCLVGFLFLLRGGRWVYPASVCFGLSCLVRANYVIWIGVYWLLVIGHWLWVRRQRGNTPHLNPLPQGERTDGIQEVMSGSSFSPAPPRGEGGLLPLPSGERGGVRVVLSVLLLSALFLLPPLLWAGRNYKVCGHFPVLSTLRGQTFYGGNNPVVANTMEMWGYWIFPDSIPGEKKAVELSRTMSEYELDVYCFNRGMGYVKTEWFSMPRLLLGKLIRAYVPIPWKPNVMSYGVGVYRGLIYLLAAFGLCWWWRGSAPRSSGAGVTPPGEDRPEVRTAPYPFAVWFLAMVLTSVAGVLVFWGCFRFAFVIEPLLVPFAAAGAGCLWSRMLAR